MSTEVSDVTFDMQRKLEKLKSLRRGVDWQMEKQRHDLFNNLFNTIEDWNGQIPNLRDVFTTEEIERLLSDSITCRREYLFIKFVAITGYKDEPELNDNGEPLLRRTTPLHHAARRNVTRWKTVISELFALYDGSSLNYSDELGLTHLHVACRYDFKGVVAKLLRNGADPNSLDRADGSTVLHAICRGKSADDSLQLFFDICDERREPVQLNIRDKSGDTALHLALRYGQERAARSLLSRGADPNSINQEGSTLLHTLCDGVRGQHRSVEIFFEIVEEFDRSVEVDARDNKGNTPLLLAVERDKKKIAALLLRNGADPNVTDSSGSTPLHVVCQQRRCDEDWVKLFFDEDVRQKVRIDARDTSGNTPLHLALSRDHLERVAVFLLRRGAEPNLANEEGSTPLHIICKTKYLKDLPKMFFEINDERHQTVMIDVVDKSGRTPLQLAVANLNLDAIDVLLDRGADLSSFVFPTESYFGENFDKTHYNWAKFILASRVLAVVDRLEKRGYELNQSDALVVVKCFAKHELFQKSSQDFDKSWHDDEEFATEAKKIMIKPSLSLHDLVKLRPEEAAKLVTYTEYHELSNLTKLCHVFYKHQGTCAVHLCERLSRGFFRGWVMDFFLKLIHHRLPLLCCDMILDDLTSQDLCNICLAAAGLNSRRR